MSDHNAPSARASWERLSALFDAASSQPTDSRDAYLDSECVGDPALRAELDALLAGAGDAPQYLQSLVSDVMGPALIAATSQEPDDQARSLERTEPLASLSGTRIRHYEVLELLGAGGMGVVYRGRDLRLGRDVALKFLAPELVANPNARRRLVREARAVSALDDANVCAMHAIEDTDDGGLCLVMAYCAEGTLRDRMRAGPLPVASALTLARQIASGLSRAHRLGLVHRDIKPANVGFADGDVVKILDFGIALHADAELAAESTDSVALIGTLPYMAPEVLTFGRPDRRADVWALGVVIYEMVTGVRPFVAPTHAEMVNAILTNETPRLTRADGALIPSALADLVDDMLSKSPERRPPDGDAVLARLRALDLASEPVPVPAMTVTGPGAIPPVRRGRLAVFLALGAVAIVSIVVAMRRSTDVAAPASLAVSRSVEPLPAIAVLPFTVRGDAALDYLREGIVDLLTPIFDGTGLLRGVDPNTVIGAAGRDVAVTMDSAEARALAGRVGAQRYVSGSVVRAGSQLTMRATLHHADGRDVARALVTIADADELLAGAESLVRQLIAAELRAPGDTLAAQAASMTTSKRALRAYIDGERELRDARPAAAVGHFSQAVAADSMFALAWYRLARAARWSEVDSLNAYAVRRAFALAATLPLRLQQVVSAYHALRVGSPLIAERQLRRIVSDYPTDVDAWMLLGETLFDNGPYFGRPTSDAVAAFQRVMTLDPRNREVTVYLMDLAARAGTRGQLDTLFLMYFRPNSAGEQPGIRQTYLALHDRRLRGIERDIEDPAAAQIALHRAGATSIDLRAAARFAKTLAAPANESELRVEGLLALAVLDMAGGRPELARGYWRQAERLDAEATLLARAVTYAAPSVQIDADTVRALRLALSRATPRLDGAGLAWEEWTVLRLYLGGLLSARLQDTVTLTSAIEQLASRRERDRLSEPLREALRGHLARARGDEEAAILSFEKSGVQLPFQIRSRIPALGQHADRFAHAEALRMRGRDADARRWYETLRDGPALWSAPYLALVASRIVERPTP